MTLLAALWNHDGRPAARACGAMLRAQGAGEETPAVCGGDGIALGLAAHDRCGKAERDGGPVDGACGALTLAADVRLDNRADLLARLGLTTSAWAACSDSRLMMLCFEKWGDDAVAAFVGDFALALWDRRSQRLLLARDFAGQRPLFFAETDRALAVASTARGLHALGLVPRAANEGRLLEVMAGLAQEGRATFFQGIERVEPGEMLAFRRGARSARSYWNPPLEEIRLGSAAEYAEALAEKLDQAVEARLRGVRGAVGAQLSAGLDSSAVTAAAALRWDGTVHAFTAVPSGSLPPLPVGRFGDEGMLAAETAAMYPNVEHHRIANGARLPLEALGEQLQLYERPDLNLPNLAWSSRINDAAAAAGIEVLLIATAGNATISYGGVDALRYLLAQGRIGTFLAECAAARRAGVGARTLLGGPVRHFLPRSVRRALARFRNREQHPAHAGALNPAAAEAAEIVARYERESAQAPRSSVDARLLMLTGVDPGSHHKGVLTRWNIDLRDPTADRRLVEFCLRVPLRQYFRHGTPRALIRTALKGRVPESVRCSTQRGLQSADWFSRLSAARPEMKQLLAGISVCEAARRLLNVDGMRETLEAWPAESDGFGSMAYRYGLLRGLSAGEFLRIYSSNGAGPRAVAPPARRQSESVTIAVPGD